MEPQSNKEAAPVRRRRKISRVHREVTPEGGKVGRRVDSSDEEQQEGTESSSNYASQMSRNNSTKSANLSAHKSKILSRRDKAIANQRSQSQPRVEATTPSPPKQKDSSKASDLFNFIKVARRSLSSPR